MARGNRLDRGAVVAAAAALADAEGLAALTLGALAQRLGIRTPSLYNHVAGLDGLRRDLAITAARQLLDQLQRACLGKAGDAAVLAKAHAYRAFVHAHPGLYAAMLQPVAPDDTQMQALAREMLEVTLAVLSAYGLRDEDALHAVRGLRSITHGFVTLEASGMFQMGIDLDESFERLVRTFIAGLHTTAGNEETRRQGSEAQNAKRKTQNAKLTKVTQ